MSVHLKEFAQVIYFWAHANMQGNFPCYSPKLRMCIYLC